jgi:uncharacterized protein
MRATVLSVARKHGATNVRVFGSFARGDQRKTSDIDLLVDLPDGSSLLDLVGLKLALEDALHRKVDVLTARGLNPHRRDRILREARPL